MAIIEQLREAMAASGKTQTELSEATGIQQASLSRFLTGKRGLRIEDADKLAAYFGLELRPEEKKPAKKSKGK